MRKKIQTPEPEAIRGKAIILANGKEILRISTGQTRSGQLVVRATHTSGDGKTKRKSHEFVSTAAEQNSLYENWQAMARKSGFAPKGAPMVPFTQLLG